MTESHRGSLRVVYRKCLLAFVVGWMFNTVVNVDTVLAPVVAVVIRLSDLVAG